MALAAGDLGRGGGGDGAQGQPGLGQRQEGQRRKRHIAVDTTGLLLEVLITPASVQDRDGGRPLLFNLKRARWVVERTLAWITSYRRCARDYARLPAHHQAAVYWAMTILMTRRLTRPG